MVEICGIVTKVENKVTKNGKSYNTFVLSKSDKTGDLPVSAFDGFSEVVGTEIVAKLEPNKDPKYKNFTLRNYHKTSIQPKPEVVASAVKSTSDSEVRMTRMNCLAHASELIKDGNRFMDVVDLDKCASEVMRIAERYEREYIWKK